MAKKDAPEGLPPALSAETDCADEDERRERPDWVIGPQGQKMTLDQLPPPGFTRWQPLRKAEVVAAVHGGLLTVGEALTRYSMAIEEFASWERAVKRFGLPALRVTYGDHYRVIFEKERKFRY